MLESNLKALVDNLLSAYGIERVSYSRGSSTFHPDCVVRTAGGVRTAIDVRQSVVDARGLYVLFTWYDDARSRHAIDRLLLVTPEPPSEADLRRFATTFESDAAQWVSVTQLPAALGIPEDVDLTSPQALDRLKMASLIRKTSVGPSEVVGVVGPGQQPTAPGPEVSTEPKVPKALTRQLSPKRLGDLERTRQPVEKALRIGEELRPFVLLSDIKSFSTLVRVSDANVVQEMMGTYYRRAREIVWAHGGTLDKFIGDAVLAIWGYPEATTHDASNVLRAAAALIELGRSLLDEFQARRNEAIESGTRVGIASDDVLVLNIGTDQVEVSFVGNAINLAARLETSSEVDGVLLDNRTYVALASDDAELYWLTGAQGRVLDTDHVRGQLTSIRAWQIAADGVARILKTRRGVAPTAG